MFTFKFVEVLNLLDVLNHLDVINHLDFLNLLDFDSIRPGHYSRRKHKSIYKTDTKTMQEVKSNNVCNCKVRRGIIKCPILLKNKHLDRAPKLLCILGSPILF